MPALPSFINYRPGRRRAKAAAKASLRGESSASPIIATNRVISQVIDIKDARHSLDLDGGRSSEEGNFILDDVSQQTRLSNTSSAPPAKLEIDLAPEVLSDWFAANFPGSGTGDKKGGTVNETDVLESSSESLDDDKVILGQVTGQEDLAKTSEAVIAGLESMDVSLSFIIAFPVP